MQALIKKLVNLYLKDFIDLEESAFDNLALNLWKGSLSIDDVAIRRDFVQKYIGEGFDISQAVVSKVRIKVPWTTLNSKPVVIALDDINLDLTVSETVQPSQTSFSTDKERKEKRLEAKRLQLDRIHQVLSKEFQQNLSNSLNSETVEDPDLKRKTGLTKKILDNIEIEVNNININLLFTDIGVLNLKISDIALNSVNAAWEKDFIIGESSLRKLFKVSDITLNINTSQTSFSPETSTSLLSPGNSKVKNTVKAEVTKAVHYSEVKEMEDLEECLFYEKEIILKLLVHDKNIKLEEPKYQLNVKFNLLNFNLSSAAYQIIILMLRKISKTKSISQGRSERQKQSQKLISSNLKQLPKLKIPLNRPKQGKNARKWWKFVIFTVIRRIRSSKYEVVKYQWIKSIETDYIKLYKRKLEVTANEKYLILPNLSTKEEGILELFENNDMLDIENILKLRKLAEEEIKKYLKKEKGFKTSALDKLNFHKFRGEGEEDEEKKKEKGSTGVLETISSWWWSSSPSKQTKDSGEVEGEEEKDEVVLSEEERTELFKTIGFDMDELEKEVSLFDKRLNLLNIKLKLENINLSLTTDTELGGGNKREKVNIGTFKIDQIKADFKLESNLKHFSLCFVSSSLNLKTGNKHLIQRFEEYNGKEEEKKERDRKEKEKEKGDLEFKIEKTEKSFIINFNVEYPLLIILHTEELIKIVDFFLLDKEGLMKGPRVDKRNRRISTTSSISIVSDQEEEDIDVTGINQVQNILTNLDIDQLLTSYENIAEEGTEKATKLGELLDTIKLNIKVVAPNIRIPLLLDQDISSSSKEDSFIEVKLGDIRLFSKEGSDSGPVFQKEYEFFFNKLSLYSNEKVIFNELTVNSQLSVNVLKRNVQVNVHLNRVVVNVEADDVLLLLRISLLHIKRIREFVKNKKQKEIEFTRRALQDSAEVGLDDFDLFLPETGTETAAVSIVSGIVPQESRLIFKIKLPGISIDMKNKERMLFETLINESSLEGTYNITKSSASIKLLQRGFILKLSENNFIRSRKYDSEEASFIKLTYAQSGTEYSKLNVDVEDIDIKSDIKDLLEHSSVFFKFLNSCVKIPIDVGVELIQQEDIIEEEKEDIELQDVIFYYYAQSKDINLSYSQIDLIKKKFIDNVILFNTFSAITEQQRAQPLSVKKNEKLDKISIEDYLKFKENFLDEQINTLRSQYKEKENKTKLASELSADIKFNLKSVNVRLQLGKEELVCRINDIGGKFEELKQDRNNTFGLKVSDISIKDTANNDILVLGCKTTSETTNDLEVDMKYVKDIERTKVVVELAPLLIYSPQEFIKQGFVLLTAFNSCIEQITPLLTTISSSAAPSVKLVKSSIRSRTNIKRLSQQLVFSFDFLETEVNKNHENIVFHLSETESVCLKCNDISFDYEKELNDLNISLIKLFYRKKSTSETQEKVVSLLEVSNLNFNKADKSISKLTLSITPTLRNLGYYMSSMFKFFNAQLPKQLNKNKPSDSMPLKVTDSEHKERGLIINIKEIHIKWFNLKSQEQMKLKLHNFKIENHKSNINIKLDNFLLCFNDLVFVHTTKVEKNQEAKFLEFDLNLRSSLIYFQVGQKVDINVDLLLIDWLLALIDDILIIKEVFFPSSPIANVKDEEKVLEIEVEKGFQLKGKINDVLLNLQKDVKFMSLAGIDLYSEDLNNDLSITVEVSSLFNNLLQLKVNNILNLHQMHLLTTFELSNKGQHLKLKLNEKDMVSYLNAAIQTIQPNDKQEVGVIALKKYTKPTDESKFTFSITLMKDLSIDLTGYDISFILSKSILDFGYYTLCYEKYQSVSENSTIENQAEKKQEKMNQGSTGLKLNLSFNKFSMMHDNREMLEIGDNVDEFTYESISIASSHNQPSQQDTNPEVKGTKDVVRNKLTIKIHKNILIFDNKLLAALLKLNKSLSTQVKVSTSSAQIENTENQENTLLREMKIQLVQNNIFYLTEEEKGFLLRFPFSYEDNLLKDKEKQVTLNNLSLFDCSFETNNIINLIRTNDKTQLYKRNLIQVTSLKTMMLHETTKNKDSIKLLTNEERERKRGTKSDQNEFMDIKFDKILVQLSFNDILYCLEQYKALLPVISENSKSEKQDGEDISSTADSSNVKTLYQVRVAESNMFLYDFTNIKPFSHVAISAFKCKKDVFSFTNFSVNVINTKLNSLQPFVEPFNFKIIINDLVKEQNLVNYQLLVSNDVTINVDPVQLGVLAKITKEMQTLQEKTDNLKLAEGERSRALRIKIQNLTEFPLNFERFDKESNFEDFLKSQILKVPCKPMEEINIRFDRLASRHATTASTRNLNERDLTPNDKFLSTQGLRLSYDKYISKEIIILKENKSLIKVKLKGNKILYLHWKLVKEKDNQFKAIISSSFYVKNQTKFDLKVTFKHNTKKFLLIRKESENSTSIRDLFESKGRQEEEGASKVKFRVEYLQDKSQYCDLPNLLQPKRGILKFVDSKCSFKTTLKQNSRGQYMISIMPPIKVFNFFTVPLNLEIKENTKYLKQESESAVKTVENEEEEEETVEKLSLQPGQTKGIYFYPIKLKKVIIKYFFQLTLDKYGISEWLPLKDSQKLTGYCLAEELPDLKEPRLHLFHVKQVYKKYESIEKYFYAKYILLNKTGLPLTFYREEMKIDPATRRFKANDKLRLEELVESLPPDTSDIAEEVRLEEELYLHSTKSLFLAIKGLTYESTKIDISLLTASQEIKLVSKSKQKIKEYREIIVHSKPLSSFSTLLSTSTVTHIVPKLMFYNKSLNKDDFIEVAQVNYLDKPSFIQPQLDLNKNVDGKELLWHEEEKQNIRLRIEESEWSESFSPFQPATFTFCLMKKMSKTAFYQRVVKVEIKRGIYENTFGVFFENVTDLTFDSWLNGVSRVQYLVENDTFEEIQVKQKEGNKDGYGARSMSLLLKPYWSKPFGWVTPLKEKKTVDIVVNGTVSVKFNFDDVSETKEVDLSRKSNILSDEKESSFVKEHIPYFMMSNDGEKILSSSSDNTSSSINFKDAGTKNYIPIYFVKVKQQESSIRTGSDKGVVKNKIFCYQDNFMVICYQEQKNSFKPIQYRLTYENNKVFWSKIKETLVDSPPDDCNIFVFTGGSGRENDFVKRDDFNISPEQATNFNVSYSGEQQQGQTELALTKDYYNWIMRNINFCKLKERKLMLKLDIENATRVIKIFYKHSQITDEEEESKKVKESKRRLGRSTKQSKRKLKQDKRDKIIQRIKEDKDSVLKEYSYSLFVPKLYISFFNSNLTEQILLKTSLETFLKIRKDVESLEVSIYSLRVDNQAQNAYFKNVLRTAPKLLDEKQKSRMERESQKGKIIDEPVKFTVVKNPLEKHFTYIQYCALSVLELEARLDSRFIKLVTNLAKKYSESITENWSEVDDKQKQTDLTESGNLRDMKLYLEFKELLHELVILPIGSEFIEISKDEKTLYFEVLQIFTLKCKLSYQLVNKKKEKEGSVDEEGIEDYILDPVSNVLQAFNQAIQNINSAPITLRALAMEHPSLTLEELQNQLKNHYTSEAKRNLFTVMGHVGLLGSANGALNNLGGAVTVFFNEPAQGLVKSPEDFGKGLGKGSKALFKGTVQSVANVTSTVTTSAAKTVQYLTFDKEYIQDKASRRETKATGLKDGVKSGGEGLVKSIASGVTGVVTAPREGAKKGVGGFFSGLGKGLIGAIAKPVDGVLGFVAKTTEGAAAETKSVASKVFEKDLNQTSRYPRLFINKQLINYAENDAKLVQKAYFKLVERLTMEENATSDLKFYRIYEKYKLILVLSSFHCSLLSFSEQKVENWSRRDFNNSKTLQELGKEFTGKRSLARLEEERKRYKKDVILNTLWTIKLNFETQVKNQEDDTSGNGSSSENSKVLELIQDDELSEGQVIGLRKTLEAL